MSSTGAGSRDPRAAIGVWDSGIGGLTVVGALLEALPHERFVYFGDTARVPYGSKSPATIARFAVENTLFLTQHDIKLLVVACNTASATSLDVLRQRFDMPIVGMIDAAVRTAAARSVSGHIGVIGTTATIRSEAYERALRRARPDAEVSAVACPLFVPFAEEGLIDHPALQLLADEYLAPLRAAKVDTCILGCTHYPLLRPVIERALGGGAILIDSGREAAGEVRSLLADAHLAQPDGSTPEHRYFVSDLRPHFERIGEAFLGRPLGGVVAAVEQTDLPWYERLHEAAAPPPQATPLETA